MANPWLLKAVKDDNVQMVMQQVEKSGFSVDDKDGQGRTLVGLAIVHNANTVFDYFMGLRVIPRIDHKDNDGNTPLHLAVLGKNKHALAVLLEHRADTSIKNNAGETVQDLAAQCENPEISKIIAEETRSMFSCGVM